MKFDSRVRLATVLLPLFLAACGGGGGDDAGSAPAPAPGAPPGPPVGSPPPAPAADTQAPTATLTAPVDFTANIPNTVTLTATATDNVAVTSVEFQIDGQLVGTALTAAPYSANVDTTPYASGQHVVRVRAKDAAANVSAWSSVTVSFGGSRTQPPNITRNQTWVTGLTGATAMAQAPDGRIFVTQQTGAVRVVKNGVLLATPFAQLNVDSNGERGLIGITLHPNFASNNLLYVYYTSPEGGSHNRISRFTAVGDVMGAASEERLVNLPNLSGATNHNGGGMHFGSDGKLYVGVGDNANGAQAQDLNKVFGKLLRFNDDGTIPTDNPFANSAGTTGLARATWAYGLRNPYTFAVQPGTGRIHINDVGENTWEEINLGAAGKNYGWPGSEGPANVTGAIVAPIFNYKHSAATPPGSGPGGFLTGLAITGGTFYPTTGIPAAGAFPDFYRGTYFFADFVSKFIARYDIENNAVYSFGSVSGSPVDMLSGVGGELFVLTRDSITRFAPRVAGAIEN
jgi:glucose/arabinose dehydrogenase